MLSIPARSGQSYRYFALCQPENRSYSHQADFEGIILIARSRDAINPPHKIMALAWNRAKLATTIAKAPVIQAVLTDGDTAVVDLVVDESDPDFTADTLLGRLTLVKAIEGNDLVLKLTARSWDGNDAYTSSTNPANSTATNVMPELEVLRVNLDSFWTTGGFAKTNS